MDIIIGGVIGIIISVILDRKITKWCKEIEQNGEVKPNEHRQG